MTEKPEDGKNPPTPKKRPLWKRLLRVAMVLVVLLIILVLALPTLITILPTESVVESVTNGIIRGRLEMKGLSVGYTSPLRIDEVHLYDAAEGGELILSVDNLRTEYGLISIATSQKRAGKLEIDRLYALTQRDEEGVLNWLKIAPEQSEEAPAEPAPAAEPAELKLANLLPIMELPLSELYIGVGDIELRYEDAAMAPPLNVAFEKGRFLLQWNGGEEPLALEVEGDVVSPEAVKHARFDLTVSNWISDNTLALASADIVYTLHTGTGGEPAIDGSVGLADEKINTSLGLDFSRLIELAQTAMPSLEVPVEGGRLDTKATIDLNPAEHIGAQLETALREVSLIGYGAKEGTLEVPEIILKADAHLGRDDFQPVRADLNLDSDVLRISISDRPVDGALHRVEAGIEANVEELISLMMASAFDQPMVPLVTGTVRLDATAEHEAYAPRAVDAEMTWEPGTLTWRDTSVFPPTFQPSGETMPLDKTAVVLTTKAAFDEDGAVSATVTLRNPLMNADIDATLDPAYQPETATLRLNADITQTWNYIQENFTGLPMEVAEGNVTVRQDVEVVDGTYLLDGSLNINDLLLRAPFLPGEEFQDAVTATWNLGVNPDVLLIEDAQVSLEDSYASFDLTGRYNGSEGTMAGTLKSDVRLDPLQSDITVHYVPEETVTTTGNLLLTLTADSEEEDVYTTLLTLDTNDAFTVTVSDGLFVLESVRFAAEATTELQPEGMQLELVSMSLGLDEFLEWNLDGTLGMKGTEYDIQLNSALSLFLAALVEEGASAMEGTAVDVVDLDGEVSMNTRVHGVVAMEPDGIAFPEPVVTSNTLVTELPYLYTEGSFGVVSLEGIRDRRDQTITVAGADISGVRFEESNTFGIDFLVFDPMLEIPGISYELNTTFHDGGIVDLSLKDLSLGDLTYRSESLEFRGPPMQLSMDAVYDLNTQVTDIESLDFALEDTLDIDASGRYDLLKNEAALESNGTIQSLSLLETDMIAPNGLVTEVRLDGSGTYALDLDANVNTLTMNKSLSPQGIQMNLKSNWDAVRAQYGGQFGVTGVAGSYTLDVTTGTLTTAFATSLEDLLLGAEPLIYTRGMAVKSTLSLDPSGDLVLKETEVDLPEIAGNLQMDGFLREIGSFVPPEDSSEMRAMLNHFFRRTFGISAIYTQRFEFLSGMDLVEDAGGDSRHAISLTNSPRRGLRLTFDESFSDVGMTLPDMATVEGVGGQATLIKNWAPLNGTAPSEAMFDATYNLQALDIAMPFVARALGNASLAASTGQSAINVDALTEELFGGTSNFRSQLRAEGDVYWLDCEFSATGIDGATFLPGLQKQSFSDRTLNLFGKISIPLDRDPTVLGAAESMLFQFEVTEMGSELLREYLRVLDAEGANPGIQATIGALRFSSPERVTMEMRNGLFSFAVTVMNPAGVRFTLPVLERLRVAPIVQPYLDTSLDASLEGLRNSLDLLLLDTTESLVDTIVLFSEAEP